MSQSPPPPEDADERCAEAAARNLAEVAAAAPSATRRSRPPVLLWLALLFGLASVAAGIWVLDQNYQAANTQARLATVLPEQGAGELAVSALPARLQTEAPDFSLTASDGSQVKLSGLRGKVVLVNFWATWCPPCKAEMPDLNALQQEFGSAHDLVVLGINAGDDSQAAVVTFAQQNRLSFPLLLDPDDQVSDSLYAVRALPTSLIIDRTGKIRSQWLGQLSRSEMVARLRQVW